IVCAAGKSAAEMLALLRERLQHDPADELRIATNEQAKITRLRLQKLGAMNSPITTHGLDLAHRRPAAGIPLVLEKRTDGDSWHELGRGITNADGRIPDLLPEQHTLASGVYRLRFATGDYFHSLGLKSFYPEVLVQVQIEAEGHYHLPLLLS